MLWNVDEVCRRTATLMDDPAMTEFDKDYLIPFLNINWEDLANKLSMVGLDYQEVRVVIAGFQSGTANFDDFMGDGQPLAALMLPKRVEWKPAGDPDTSYEVLRDVDDLDDVPDGTIGMIEWHWGGGSLQVTPSSADVDVRVTFLAMSTNLVDPNDNMVRGCTNVIAYATASLIYTIRGNDPLALKMENRSEDALETFERAAVMRDQAKSSRMPPQHPRYLPKNFYVTATPTQ